MLTLPLPSETKTKTAIFRFIDFLYCIKLLRPRSHVVLVHDHRHCARRAVVRPEATALQVGELGLFVQSVRVPGDDSDTQAR